MAFGDDVGFFEVHQRIRDYVGSCVLSPGLLAQAEVGPSQSAR